VNAPLALLSPDAGLDARLRAVIGEEHTDLRRWRDEYLGGDPGTVARELAEDRVGVVCLGPELGEGTALDLARAFDVDHPEICVVLLADAPSAALWEGALRAGVRGVITPETAEPELRAVLTGALDTAARRRSIVAPSVAVAPERQGRTIVVLSPKGGSGKTMVAVNLAVILARDAADRVALLDLDLQFGDVANCLQIAPQHTLADAARSPVAPDATALKVFLSSHPSSGLWVLAAPDTPPEADEVTPELAVHAARALADEFAIVVVDTPAGLDEHTLAVIEAATDLLLVSTMDVSSIRSLRKELDVLDALQLTDARRHLVLNRADAKVGLAVRDVETVLGLPVDLAVPSTRAVPTSVNQGVPLIESDPRAPVSRQLEQLAARFVPAAQRGTGAARLPWRREAR
jgi:pilus assembly protein CpaE